MRLFSAAIMLSILGATPALAQETPFQGISVTSIGGVDHDRIETQFVYGGQLGYDWQRGATVFGIEAEIIGIAASERCYAPVAAPGATDRLCGNADRDLYIGGRVGRVIGDTTLLYVKAGYANARSTFSYVDGGAGAGNYSGSDTRSGVRVGVGTEKAIGNLLIKAEYRYSNYADGYSRHQGMAGIGLRF